MFRTAPSEENNVQQLGQGVAPGLHIIVRNGYVTLRGTVYAQMDSLQAESIARSTRGVIRVTNELRTRKELVEATGHQVAGSDD